MTQPAEAILKVIRILLADFYEPHEIEQWLDYPHVDLDGERPMDAIKTMDGRGRVMAIIDRLQSGAYL